MTFTGHLNHRMHSRYIGVFQSDLCTGQFSDVDYIALERMLEQLFVTAVACDSNCWKAFVIAEEIPS